MTTTQNTSAHVFAIGPQEVKETHGLSPAEVEALVGTVPVVWVDFDGPVSEEVLAEYGRIFKLHRLSLDDVKNNHQRPKVEHYPNYHFIVTRMVSLHEHIESEQLGIFFGKNFVVTFQGLPGGDCLEPLRASLRSMGTDALRTMSADFLAYAIVDMVVDGFFPVINTLGERLNDLEEDIYKRHDAQHPARIHAIKRDVRTLRQTIWPVRDALASLQRDNMSHIQKETTHYLRDCQDHALRIIELVESHQASCTDLMELQMSRENSRMNEILRVLTIISTLFIPPTFIAGIYGMNFHGDKSPFNMPELDWYLGYPFALGVMLFMMGGLVTWMWWRGWLTGVTSRRFQNPLKRLKAHKELMSDKSKR